MLPLLIGSVVFFNNKNADKSIYHQKIKKPGKYLTGESLERQFFDEREEEHKKPDQPDKFVEYLMSLKTGENGETYEGNYKIREFKKAELRLAQLKTATVQLDWQERGPGNVGGRTRGLVVDPKDVSQKTWLAGSVSGGVWRTTDAGNTWACLTPDIPDLATVCLTISLDDPNVIYVGTGEGYYNIDAVIGAGIFKSTDNGATWEQLASTKDNANFYFVNRIITDPDNVNVVIAATNRGVFKSVDGGKTWTQTLKGRVQQIIYEKDNFSNQYSAVNSYGVYKSVNGGNSWFNVKSYSDGRIEMAIAPSDENIVYALTADSELFMSVDGGYNWAQSIEKPETDFMGGQGWYNNSLVVSPLNSKKVFVGGIDIHLVTISDADADDSVRAVNVVSEASDWIDFGNFNGGYLKGGFSVNNKSNRKNCKINFVGSSTQKAHRFVKEGDVYVYKDFIDVPFNVVNTDNNQKLNVSFIDIDNSGDFNLTETNPEYIYIHYTTYTGSASSEIAVNNGINVKNIYSLWPVMQPGKVWDPGSLSAHTITVDNYYLKSKKMSSKRKTYWYNDMSAKDYAHADHHALVVFKKDLYSFSLLDGNDGGIAVSYDQGDTWASPVNGYNTSQFYSVAKHPEENRYLGGMQDNGTYFSEANPGMLTYWTPALGGDGFGSVWHSRNPSYMIGSLYYNNIYLSDDSGKNWQNISQDIEDSGSDSGAPFITTIASSNDDPDLLFVGGPSGLWRSDNFGINWQKIVIDKADYGYANGSVYMEISKADPSIVWAGVRMDDNGKLNLSVDGGYTFKGVSNYKKLIRRISGVATHPFDPDVVYVLNSAPGSPKVIRSEDRGQTWTDISGFGDNTTSSNGFPDVAVYSLLVMPGNTDEIWAGTEIGLFISTDNGASWHYSNNGLPAVCIWQMKIVGSQVVLATHGRGIWTVDIPGLSNIPPKPYIQNSGKTPDNKLKVKYEIEADFDSLDFYFNKEFYAREYAVSQGLNEYEIDKTSSGSRVNCQVVGYKNGISFPSNLSYADNYSFEVPKTRYVNYFEVNKDDFYGDGFYVYDSLENNFAIHTDHPYHVRRNLTYVLRYPIVILEDKSVATMKYDDIAFVEKGEDGTKFGDAEFWDYVVVEGSKDGIEWLPLADGYDFGYSDKWEGNDIYSVPSRDLLVTHSIDLQDVFEPRDTILVRFRLYSDAAETGWGWMIDNVKIQKDATGIFNKINTPEGTLTVSPNPAYDHIDLKLESRKNGKLILKVYDLDGRLLYDREFNKYQQLWRKQLQVGNWGKGVKIVNIFLGKDHYSERIVTR